jgi:hypothetical protein
LQSYKYHLRTCLSRRELSRKHSKHLDVANNALDPVLDTLTNLAQYGADLVDDDTRLDLADNDRARAEGGLPSWMRYIWNQHGRGEIHSERCAPRSPPALALRVALRLERLAPSALATLWILTATAEALASAELMTLRTLVALAVELGSTLHTLVTEDTGERRSGADVRRNKTCTGARVTVLF